MSLGQDIDYEALARQHGAISSMPVMVPGKNGEIDYEALAKQHGAIGSTPAPQPSATQPEGFLHSLGAVFNLTPESFKAAQEKTAGMNPLQEALAATTPHPIEAVKSAATAVAHEFQKGSEEGKQTLESAQRGDIPGVMAHTIGQVGHAGATLTAPVMGELPSKAGEQFGAGNIRGGMGTAAGLIAPVAAAGMIKGKVPAPAGEVTPTHVEALTGLIDDRAGTVDPHATATAALPTLRETAVREGIDPTKLKGREAGQATLKIAEQAVRDTQNEFNDIRKPYNSVLVDQKPIAQAYRNAITPELLANEPKVAAALERSAKKFDQPAPLEQVNQFRIRMNNQLNAFEQRGTTAQIMSDIETKATKAATDAARDVEYDTVGRLSGLDPEYIRSLKQREGSLIEAKSSLTKEYNRASGQQGEAVSEGVREKLTNTFPSKHGATKSVVKNLIGPKPIEVLNNRIQKMFADMGVASTLPEYEQVQPPTAPSLPEGGPSGPVPSGEDAIDEATRGGPGVQPPVAPDTSQTFSRGGKMGTLQGIADQVVAAKSGQAANATARVDAHKVAKSAIGEQVQQPVAPSKPIYEMSVDELEAAAKADLSKGNTAINQAFGKDAGTYRRLQIQADDPSKSFDEIKQITSQMDAMEKRLSPEQRSILYREGESGLSHEDYINFRNSLMHISGDTPQELGNSMRHAVTNLGDADLHNPENMSLNQQRAYAQLRYGFRRASEEGFNPNDVWQSALKGASSKFRDSNDAAFMLQRFTKGNNQLKLPVAPSATVAAGQITPEHVAAENAFYTQARAELGANASPSAVLQRAQALKIEHSAKGAPPPVTPVPPTVRPTLTQKMQAQPLPTLRRVQPPAGGTATPATTPRQQATALMLLVKQGKLTPAEADSKIQRLVGAGGRRTIRRPVGPE